MRDSYHFTEWKLFPDAQQTLHAGDVVRMNSWGAFPDCVILGFNDQGDAKVSRPYAYTSSVGTTSPTVLLGTETYSLPAAHILTHYSIIDNDGHRTV